MSTEKHYVNNADFLAALIKYRTDCEDAQKNNTTEPKIPNYIGECFLKIAEHLSRQIIYYAFLRRIMREKKQLYVKYKATQQFGLLDEGEMYEDENGNMKQFELYDNISEFIHNFEENKKKKGAKKATGIEQFIDDTDNQ
jgi:hypothetical protein